MKTDLAASFDARPISERGIYAFATKELWAKIDRLTTKNVHGEFYLTDMATLLVKARKRVLALPATGTRPRRSMALPDATEQQALSQ